ncbi:MAG: SpoIIE family protein phosphatase [Acidobacteriota bacterium]
MPHLVITTGDGHRTTVELKERQHYSIGRSSSNDLVLKDLALSRTHAQLHRENGAWMIEDTGSRNGTFLNEVLLKGPHRLQPGDRIRMGSSTIQFQPPRESVGRVIFSDQPLTHEGTVMLSVDEVMTHPDATPRSFTQDSSESINSRARRFRVIEQANLELLGHLPMERLLPKILALVSEAVKPDRVALFLDENGKLSCRAFRGGESDPQMSISRTITRKVMTQHVSVLTSDALSDERFRERASIMGQGIRSVMAVPLWNNREVIGLIYADSRLASGLFDAEDLRVLTMLANIAAIQIENGRLFAQRLEMQRHAQEARAAAEIQKRLLPSSPPDLPGYLLEGLNIPCSEVGGDYFDYVRLNESRHAIILADVAGHGMSAAMLMSNLQATCRARLDSGPEPGDLINRLNTSICRTSPNNRFVTMCYLDLDHERHRLRLINAGHAPAPYLVHASGKAESVEAGGLPLGILETVDYSIFETILGKGDFAFLCSDGVTETADTQGHEFGEDRLRSLLRSLAGQPPDEVRQAVEESLEKHAAGTPQPDDLTMVILQRTA